ncbi:MAG: lipoyl(octanoyl) transferase LipB, partial [Deltaproteobacteria bacterium]
MEHLTHKVLIVDLETIAYQEAWDLQHRIHDAKQAGLPADVLLLLEHPHVFTLGKNAKKENILVPETVLRDQGIDCVAIERGGDVTYHGPGQLVGYPIFYLEALKLRVVDFVDRLEEVMIRVLKSYGLAAQRSPVNRGVWVKTAKLGFVGIALRRGITLHGFALNVAPKLAYYDMIYSCGLKGVEIVSLSSLLRRSVSMDEVKKKTLSSFEDVFALKTEPISLS